MKLVLISAAIISFFYLIECSKDVIKTEAAKPKKLEQGEVNNDQSIIHLGLITRGIRRRNLPLYLRKNQIVLRKLRKIIVKRRKSLKKKRKNKKNKDKPELNVLPAFCNNDGTRTFIDVICYNGVCFSFAYNMNDVVCVTA